MLEVAWVLKTYLCDLVLKEIYGIGEKKNPIKKQVNEYKITKRQIYKKFNNLSEKELTSKNNKKTYIRNEKNKLMKKDRLTETIFKEKRQKALEKKTWL